LRQGDAASADRLLTEARALFGNRTPSPAWYHAASLAAALSGDLERAHSILSEGIGVFPHAAVLFNNQAVVQERRGQFDDAFAVADRGVQEDPGLPQLHKNLADAHYRAGRADEALEHYDRAVKLNRSIGADSYLKIGNIRFKREERSAAIEAWERALELDPGNAIVRTNIDAARRLA
jgi:tetratricopeptide (TPR) repeat protein